jgi:hypothetical protein
VKLARASIAVRGERPATVETLARACEAAKDRTCARDTYAKLAKAPGAPDALRARAEEKLKALSD